MKILKRTGAALLCLCLLLALLPGALAGETEESVLRVGTAGGQRGETVALEVSLSAVNGIAAIRPAAAMAIIFFIVVSPWLFSKIISCRQTSNVLSLHLSFASAFSLPVSTVGLRL